MKQLNNLQIKSDLILSLIQYIPTNNIKGIILICHGMAEHIKRYENFMDFLCQNDYIAAGYDQRGHGKTAGTIDNCGYMDDYDNFEVLVDDLEFVCNYLKLSFPKLPIFIIGHSMGSFVLQRYLQLYGSNINGAILIGSNYNKGLKVILGYYLAALITLFKGRKYKSKFVDKMCFGKYNKKIENQKTKFDWLSKDELNNQNYIEDEYCGMIFSVSYFKDLTANFKKITKNFDLVLNDIPIYLLSGDADPVGDYGKGVISLYKKYQKIGVTDIKLKIYKEARHELLNEINKKEIYQDIITWIKQRKIK